MPIFESRRIRCPFLPLGKKPSEAIVSSGDRSARIHARCSRLWWKLEEETKQELSPHRGHQAGTQALSWYQLLPSQFLSIGHMDAEPNAVSWSSFHLVVKSEGELVAHFMKLHTHLSFCP